jgi:hypothetical protein
MAIRHLGALAHDQELILITLVVGMAASGTILLSAVPSAALSYMSGILIPSAAKCFILLDHKAYLLLGVLAVSYWWFLAALTSGNTMVEGPDVSLTAAATQAIAMVLHELTTNAAKYGALSTPQGLVSVRWGWQANGRTQATLELAWQEQGGPIVAISDQAGYGTSVIRDLIPYELGGQVNLVFAPEGVCCTIGVPPDYAIQGDREMASAANRSVRARPKFPEAR